MKIKALNYLTLGIVLFSFSLGGIFAIDLARYSFYLLMAAFLVTLYFYNESILHRDKTKKGQIPKDEFYSGLLGLFLLAGFMGIQSPQLPFKIYVLAAGLVFVAIYFLKR